MDLSKMNSADEAKALHAVDISGPRLWIKEPSGPRVVSKVWFKLWPFKAKDTEVIGPALERAELEAMLKYFGVALQGSESISSLVQMVIQKRKEALSGQGAPA